MSKEESSDHGAQDFNNPWKSIFDQFRVDLDPDQIDQSIRDLQEKIKQVALDGRYTKIRILFKGEPLMPDIPIGFIAMAEMTGLEIWAPVRRLVKGLNANAFIEIQIIHESSEKVEEGKQHYSNGDVELAEKAYLEALKIRPTDMEAHFRLGVLYRVQGKKEVAMAHFQQAVASNHPVWAPKAGEILSQMLRSAAVVTESRQTIVQEVSEEPNDDE